MGTVYPCGPNKEFSSRFCVGSRVRQETPEKAEGDIGWNVVSITIVQIFKVITIAFIDDNY